MVEGNTNYCPYCGVHEGFVHTPTCPHRENPSAKDIHAQIDKVLEDKRQFEEGAYKPPLHIITTIPPEVEQYAPEIARFVEAMVYKLGVKAHKGKWENMPIQTALMLLRGEEEELTEAVARGNMVEIMLEAADVANFALIASAIAMEKK